MTVAPDSHPEDPTAGADESTFPLPSRSEAADEVIDRYRLLERLGEGGFGRVYLAEQLEPVRRRVALKVIKLGMDTRQVIARFEAERQALAMMDHPGIAKVLDAGATETGRPYFVMELVRGEPITDYCNRHKLDPRQRLELFKDVCHAVQHAHQKGIIHRDLKPSNVMVTERDDTPAPKVIDFGIAKATGPRLTEKTIVTEQHQFIGTPEYMAPEQADPGGVDIDTRCDVYALGVLLYELLTGTTPFDRKSTRNAGLGEMIRVIREEDPPRPSTRLSGMATGQGDERSSAASIAKQRRSDPAALARALRGDLDWIVMKCLEKERARRYETANALAMDIVRHLEDEPVLAGPPGAGYRVGKFARRHRGLLVAAGLVAAALVAGLAVAAVGFYRASEEADRAFEAEQQAVADRDAAGLARDQSEAVTRFLTTMLSAVDPGKRGRDVTVREVLDEAAETIGGQFPDQPLVEARLRGTMAQTYHALGLYDDASVQAELAAEIFEREHGADHLRTLTARVEIARSYWRQGKLDEAEAINREVLEKRLRIIGEEKEATIDSMLNVAVSDIERERYEDARAMLERVRGIASRILGPEHHKTLRIKSELGRVHAAQDRPEDAVRLYREVIDGWTAREGERHPRTLYAMNRLGFQYRDMERYDDAEPLLVRTLEQRREVLGEDHPDTIMSIYNLAHLMVDLERDDEAERLYLETIEKRERMLGVDHVEVGAAAMTLGIFYAQRDRHADAEPQLRRTVDIYRATLGVGVPQTGRAIRNLGLFLWINERQAEAEPLYVEVLTLERRRVGERHPATIKAMDELAELKSELDPPDPEAVTLAQHAVELAREVLGPEHRQTRTCEETLAKVRERLGTESATP